MSNYLRRQLKAPVPQSEPLDGMSKNSAGGYTYTISPMDQLKRFLVLGTEGGTYYATERKLTKENLENIQKIVDSNGIEAVDVVVDFSLSGRIPKNDTAILALAMLSASKDAKVRAAALDALPKVCRIGTHLFTFLDFVQEFRGWGRGLKTAVRDWYYDKSVNDVVYQVLKYGSRNGWTHRDAFRLAHPYPTELGSWIAKGDASSFTHPLIEAVKEAKSLTDKDVSRACKLVRDYNLAREMLPTHILNVPEVQEALLERMPMHAMLRNLGNMGKSGLLTPLSKASKHIIEVLSDTEKLHRSRVHPVDVLLAYKTYGEGMGMRGSGRWVPVEAVKDALEEAFYASFKNVEPTGKNFYIGLDVSGSMNSPILNLPMSAREACVLLAMTVMRSEKNYELRGFTSSMQKLDIGRNDSLEEAIKKTSRLPFGATNCALPMLDALRNDLDVDVFVVLTDSETWHGPIHPSKALKMYQDKKGKGKLVVVGTTATNFSIADPNDPTMMDVVGFDTNVPKLIQEFAING